MEISSCSPGKGCFFSRFSKRIPSLLTTLCSSQIHCSEDTYSKVEAEVMDTETADVPAVNHESFC